MYILVRSNENSWYQSSIKCFPLKLKSLQLFQYRRKILTLHLQNFSSYVECLQHSGVKNNFMENRVGNSWLSRIWLSVIGVVHCSLIRFVPYAIRTAYRIALRTYRFTVYIAYVCKIWCHVHLLRSHLSSNSFVTINIALAYSSSVGYNHSSSVWEPVSFTDPLHRSTLVM